MDGITVGVFGTDKEVKAAFESAVAKKSEAEGIAVYTRTEGGRRYSLLDAGDYPERVQGYARIASIADYAVYLFPRTGRLLPPDGELAVLIEAFGMQGTLEILDSSTTPEQASSFLRGTAVSRFLAEQRQSGDAAVDLSRSTPRNDFPDKGTIVYMDRVFTVKGVGTVALGFVLCGTVKLHDQLRPIPGPSYLRADVKGIQVNDVDFDSAGRGFRVGLSLRGVDLSDLVKSHWLDDGSFQITASLDLELTKSPFYRQEAVDRDLHIQLPGEMTPSRVSGTGRTGVNAELPSQVPVWDGMRTCLVDLNGGTQRIVGGATVKF